MFLIFPGYSHPYETSFSQLKKRCNSEGLRHAKCTTRPMISQVLCSWASHGKSEEYPSWKFMSVILCCRLGENSSQGLSLHVAQLFFFVRGEMAGFLWLIGLGLTATKILEKVRDTHPRNLCLLSYAVDFLKIRPRGCLCIGRGTGFFCEEQNGWIFRG